MVPGPGSTASGWKVTGQTEETSLDQGGRPVRGWRVYYATDRGVAGSVFVAGVQYTPDNVRAALMAAVQANHAVADLQG